MKTFKINKRNKILYLLKKFKKLFNIIIPFERRRG